MDEAVFQEGSSRTLLFSHEDTEDGAESPLVQLEAVPSRPLTVS